MKSQEIQITWLGHSTFKIETGGKTILIDPWVMNNPACPDSQKKFDKIDLMWAVSRRHLRSLTVSVRR